MPGEGATNMKIYNVGIIGAGHIAIKMANTLCRMDRANSYAVASRDINRAREFAAQYGFEHAYGSYEALMSDPAVDIIYVATPHSLHYEHVRQCILHGKAVICEKSFTVNAAEAERLIRLSEEHGVFVEEAIWTRYMPLMATLKSLCDSGIIGTPQTLSANLCYPISHKERIMRPELGGGALLDIGVYALNFAAMVFGHDIESINTACQKTDTGMDATETITLWYKGGRMATLYSSIYTKSDRAGVVSGENGHIIVENINNPSALRVVDENYNVVATYNAPPQITGFEYEVDAAIDALDQGAVETSFMPHAETLRMMRLMDSLRLQWGVTFPADKVDFNS